MGSVYMYWLIHLWFQIYDDPWRCFRSQTSSHTHPGLKSSNAVSRALEWSSCPSVAHKALSYVALSYVALPCSVGSSLCAPAADQSLVILFSILVTKILPNGFLRAFVLAAPSSWNAFSFALQMACSFSSLDNRWIMAYTRGLPCPLEQPTYLLVSRMAACSFLSQYKLQTDIILYIYSLVYCSRPLLGCSYRKTNIWRMLIPAVGPLLVRCKESLLRECKCFTFIAFIYV